VKDRSLLPVISTMVRLSFVVAVVIASAGCGASTSTQERQEGRQPEVVSHADRRGERHVAQRAVPDNPTDTSIRRDLNLAISHDADLKDRDITFIVANGDVSVSGAVRTEEERKKINDLAMSIARVKSVANAVLIAE
jgi:hypothetical protein